jgi:hypothetical protein
MDVSWHDTVGSFFYSFKSLSLSFPMYKLERWTIRMQNIGMKNIYFPGNWVPLEILFLP